MSTYFVTIMPIWATAIVCWSFFFNFVTFILVPIATRKMTVEVEGHQNHDRDHGALGKLSTISQLIVLVFTTCLGFEVAESE